MLNNSQIHKWGKKTVTIRLSSRHQQTPRLTLTTINLTMTKTSKAPWSLENGKSKNIFMVGGK